MKGKKEKKEKMRQRERDHTNKKIKKSKKSGEIRDRVGRESEWRKRKVREDKDKHDGCPERA